MGGQTQAYMGSPDLKVRVHEGGSVWSGAAVAVAVFGLFRLFSVVPAVLVWLFSDECLPVTDNPLDVSQIAIVVATGIAALVLAEYGTRRAGSRWLGIIASVLGVVLVVGGAGLALTLATPSLSCGA